jgi:cytochrome b6-f complex iron-sulfur subunit
MERKDFLKRTFAFCGLALIPAAIIESCSKQAGTNGVNFTLDLTNPANAGLNIVGGYLVTGEVIVIKYTASQFVAFSAVCTHAACTVGYSSSASQIVCPCHGGTFSPATGAVISGPPPSQLAKYTVTQIGSILTVQS